MDNLENVYIPDSPLSTYPDVMVNSGSETDSKSPNTKRRLVIKKKSPSTQNLTSLTAGDDQDRIRKFLRISYTRYYMLSDILRRI